MRRRYHDTDWDDMSPVCIYEGHEIRVDPEGGKFGYWRGKEFRLLASLAAIKSEISQTARAVPAIAVSHDYDRISRPARVCLVGREGRRWRLASGDLTNEYSAPSLYPDDPELLEALGALADASEALRQEHAEKQAELQERKKALLDGRPTLTTDNWKEYREK